jgi:WD40 repeat protein
MATSPDGRRVFVTGYSTGSGTDFDYATVAYKAATGTKLWVARYNGPGNDTDIPKALGMSPDGTRVFVTGYSTGSGTSNDYATVAYDASTGTKLWVTRYNGPGNSLDAAEALGVSPDGTRVFVTGGSYGALYDDYAAVAYDASTGKQLWVARYDGPGHQHDNSYALGVSPDGTTVFVTGTSYGSPVTGNDYATVAYDTSTGDERWVARMNGFGDQDDAAVELLVSPDGTSVFVTGDIASGDIDWDTVAYEAATGTPLWERVYADPTFDDDGVTALAVSPDGLSVFATGTSGRNKAIVAYSSSGAELWQVTPDSALEYALAVSPDSSTLFLAGESYTTMALDATTGHRFGTLTSFEGGTASRLVVSPDGGAMYVTGWFGANTTDFVTLAIGLT